MIVPIPKEQILPEITKSIKENVAKELEVLGGLVPKLKIIDIVWTADGLDVHLESDND